MDTDHSKSTLKVLCVGDVVGKPGRFALSQAIPLLKKQYELDCVIANVENASGGSGITISSYQKIVRYGVDLMTLGDHIYKRREIIPSLERSSNIVKPINLSSEAPGHLYAIHETSGGVRVAVLSVLGQMFMRMQVNSPFDALDHVLGLIPPQVKVILVDVHAEATSEKISLGWFLDGRVSCVFGTHTHVQTSDETLLPQGTAYITDLGMTGPHDSVLGRRKDRVVYTMRTGIPSPFDVAKDGVILCGAVVEIDIHSGKARSMERIRYDCSHLSEAAGADDDPES